jgi:hypothetical protein
MAWTWMSPSRLRRQRWGFGPGEDHNWWMMAEYTEGARRGSQPLRGRRLPGVRAGSAGASAPARITTTASGNAARAAARVAPGLRPGEDHNPGIVVLIARGSEVQRRDLGSGEDHNNDKVEVAPGLITAAPGLRPGENHNICSAT